MGRSQLRYRVLNRGLEGSRGTWDVVFLKLLLIKVMR
jgi:hypothetical protein